MTRMTAIVTLAIAVLGNAVVRADVSVFDQVRQPFSVVFDEQNVLFGVEYSKGNRVFSIRQNAFRVLSGKVPANGKRAATDVAEGDGGPAAGGRFNGMHDLVRSHDGSRLYIADTFNNRIRVIDLASDRVETLFGGGPGEFADGPLADAQLNQPFTVDLHPSKNLLLIADLRNYRVREVDLDSGLVRTIAGTGERGRPQDDAQATKVPLVSPRAAIYGADGSIYVASREGNAVRVIDAEGKIRTVINRSGKKGYAGDGGPGVDARLSGPKHLSLDPAGNVVIADDQNHCVRIYDVTSGKIDLLAGIPGSAGTAIGDGRLDTQLQRPHGARYDRRGRLWVCDSWNNRLLCFEK